MTIDINENMDIKIISGSGKVINKTISFVLADKIKRNPCVVKFESLTMVEYIPIIHAKATIPDKFNICSYCELSVIVNKSGNYFETDAIRIRLKGVIKMQTLQEAMEVATQEILENEELITPINNILMINPETRVIEVPESERLFGVNFDKDVEKKYFKCPKIVGNNIDLSKYKIYVVYQKANENITTLMGEVGKYWCEDVRVDETGDYIEFSWLLSGNVLEEQGFIAFKVVAVYTDTETGELKTRWNTVPSVGLVRFTLSDGEEITEQYADVISQLLQRMDAVEDIATPEAMKGYVEQYFNEHPIELDESLTDSKKAAPANLVGQIKEDLGNLNMDNNAGQSLISEKDISGKRVIINMQYKLLGFNADDYYTCKIYKITKNKKYYAIGYGKKNESWPVAVFSENLVEDGTTPYTDYILGELSTISLSKVSFIAKNDGYIYVNCRNAACGLYENIVIPESTKKCKRYKKY